MSHQFTRSNHESRFWRLVSGLTIFLTGLAVVRFGLRILALLVQKRLNPIRSKPPYQVSKDIARLHSRLLIADLHADPLLWGTDLSRQHTFGHMDIPRLGSANVALQVFGVVTKVPLPEPDATFSQGVDLVALLSLIELWPVRCWWSLTQRALYQAQRLSGVAARSAGRFMLIRSSQELAEFLVRRETDGGLLAGLLALEGAHALQGKVGNVDVLYDAGLRMVGLTHLFDNDAGGASLGADRYGLSDFGREVLKRLEARRIILDLAHASSALFDDVLAVTTRPILVSHTGVQGVCPNPRNLTDVQVRQLAQRGGLIGIGFDALFTCTSGVKPIADSIEYVARLVGAEHVALGSDFDGAISPPFDITGIPLITAQLAERGFTEPEIRQIMGENAIRFLIENLP